MAQAFDALQPITGTVPSESCFSHIDRACSQHPTTLCVFVESALPMCINDISASVHVS